jgi:hypothetical protein
MLPSRFLPFRKQSLTSVGADGRESAPLRAYGKLNFAAEYLRVHCDDHPAGRSYTAWVDDGFNRAESLFGRGGFRLRAHRLVFAAERGRTWVVASIWDSTDRPNDQNTGRVFPFTLFAIVPSSNPKRSCPAVGAACGGIWSGLDAAYPHLSAAEGRGKFADRVRLTPLRLPGSDDSSSGVRPAGAGDVRLRDWLRGAVGGESGAEGLLAALQRSLLEYTRTKGASPTRWRLPLAGDVDPLVQLDAWLEWLDRNLGCAWDEFSVILPSSLDATRNELCVVLGARRPEDFILLSSSDGQLDQAPFPRVAGGTAVRNQQTGFSELLASQLPVASSSLADFARCRFPRPVVGSRR